MSKSKKIPLVIAPGARIEVRDAEWLVRRVDATSTGGQKLTCDGISGAVMDTTGVFLTEYESTIQLLKPENTRFVSDLSPGFRNSLLFIESLLRKTAPTDEYLYVGHKAAMDLVPYQLDPAIQALQQPRQRILVADAVGLGKTMEAGILVSELIKRGKGKRILVLAVKSMLTQFQKEFWNRFTIPLTRLDSIGIQRIRRHIPTNHNPFYYYDKSIISIDTLKQDGEYRGHIEKAYWDIIIIDEAHNVADRGTAAMRNRLARLVAHRSDTLIMLSATPHDGKPRSFASLMNMLDPTAIADPEHYTRQDIEGLFIRRFKKDICKQVTAGFKERKISEIHARADDAEERVFATMAGLRFTRIDRRKTAETGDTDAGPVKSSRVTLFKTTLEKALFSSPDACLETIENRIKTMEKHKFAGEYKEDIEQLRQLERQLRLVAPEQFSKFQRLLQLLKEPDDDLGWNPRKKDDRLVIFTERIKTLEFLKTQLTAHLGLKEKQVETLRGDMTDIEQQRVVEAFGNLESPVRLLIATDVASEGINLHFYCHRLIHFDIPWSLMVFQQRNGRIDRYGQKENPHIIYMLSDCRQEKIKGDYRILEVLIEKDKQAATNIGDPQVFMNVYDQSEEEKITAGAIEEGRTQEQFRESLEPAAKDDLLDFVLGLTPTTGTETGGEDYLKQDFSIFPTDLDYLSAGMDYYKELWDVQYRFYSTEERGEITLNDDLRHWFSRLPREIVPEDGILQLTADKTIMDEQIRLSRRQESAWPNFHYLWEQHPLMEWMGNKIASIYDRLTAPLLRLPELLPPEQTVFVVSAILPNLRGQPLLHHWSAITFESGNFRDIRPFSEIAARIRPVYQRLSNPGHSHIPETVKNLLPLAVEQAVQWMREERKQFEERINEKLNRHLNALERLKENQLNRIDAAFDPRDPQKIRQSGPAGSAARRDQKQREIKRIFDDYLNWIQNSMTTSDKPYIQVVAVITGGD